MTGIIVTGMHRSGTSLTTRMLAAGGWHPGEDLLAGPGHEYFEDASFVDMNRRWIAPLVPAGYGHADWGISTAGVVDLVAADPAVRAGYLAEAEDFVGRRDAARARWVAKDPRAMLTLPVWGEVGDLRFVLVYRNPWDVVDSVVRLGTEVFCRSPRLALDAWLDHANRLVAFAGAHRDRCVVLAAEAVALDPDRAARVLAGAVGMAGDGVAGVVDPDRFVHRDDGHAIAAVYRDVYPGHVRALEALDELADLPRLAVDDAAPRAGRARPGGSLPAGTGVQVVIACRDDGGFLAEAVASVDQCADGEVELTVVDDGSVDPETLRVLEVLRATGRQVVTTPGVGLAAARNAGAATSRTAAVVPLDADNRVCAALVGAAGAVVDGDVDVVHGSWRRFGMASGVVTAPDLTVDAVVPVNTIDACAVFSRTLLDRVGGWDPALPLWEDWDLWIGVLAVGARSRRVDGVTFEYLVRPGALSTVAVTDPAARERVVQHVVAKHEAFLGPLVAGLVLSVHRLDLARQAADRAAAEAAAARDEADRSYADLAGRHTDLEQRQRQARGELDRTRAQLADAQAEADRLRGELAAVRSRRSVRLADWLSARLGRGGR